MSEVNAELDRLLEKLESSPAVRPADAIDKVLVSKPRTTAARSLRDDEVIKKFRAEVVDGLIRVDTVQKLLGLIRLAMEAAKP